MSICSYINILSVTNQQADFQKKVKYLFRLMNFLLFIIKKFNNPLFVY